MKIKKILSDLINYLLIYYKFYKEMLIVVEIFKNVLYLIYNQMNSLFYPYYFLDFFFNLQPPCEALSLIVILEIIKFLLNNKPSIIDFV